MDKITYDELRKIQLQQKQIIDLLTNLDNKYENLLIQFNYENMSLEQAKKQFFSDILPISDEIQYIHKNAISQLSILNDICTENGITFWISFGSLLGAYRNSKMIPWDDDIDIQMKRDDLNKLIEIIPKYNYSIVKKIPKNYQTGIVYSLMIKGSTTIDLMPVDCIPITSSDIVATYRSQYETLLYKIKSKYSANDDIILTEEDSGILDKFINKYKKEILTNCVDKYVYGGIECQDDVFTISNYNDIFPLKKIIFEGFLLNMPNKAELVLKNLYGKDLYKIPIDFGVTKHQ